MAEDAEPSGVVCKLGAADYKARLARIEALNADALRDYQRGGRRIELTYDPAAATRVREFVHREQECCPSLDFRIRHEGRALIVVIEAPEDASAAADALFAPYSATRIRGQS
jgi:hypothetical protein